MDEKVPVVLTVYLTVTKPKVNPGLAWLNLVHKA